MTTTLAIDVGQSGSRLVLRRPQGLIDRLIAPGLASDCAPNDGVLALISKACAQFHPSVREIDVVAAGLTGLQGQAPDARSLLDRLHNIYGTRRVALADDCVTAYLGALGTTPGAVVAAGTGAVALATDFLGRHARVDGWGHTVGDLGGGYWIGRHGLTQALREFDGRAGSPMLLTLARKRFGEPATLGLRLAATPHRIREVASFAPDVTEAACSGDAAARSICERAAEYLAESVTAALARLDDVGAPTVSWSGALFDAGAALIDPFGSAVRRRVPDAVVVTPLGTAIDGVERLTQIDELAGLRPLAATASLEDS